MAEPLTNEEEKDMRPLATGDHARLFATLDRDRATFQRELVVSEQTRLHEGVARGDQIRELTASLAEAKQFVNQAIESLHDMSVKLEAAELGLATAIVRGEKAEQERDANGELLQAAEADIVAMGAYFVEYGAQHEDLPPLGANQPDDTTPCPEDDTCACPLLVAMRDAHAQYTSARMHARDAARISASAAPTDAITLPVAPDDDPEITCIACGLRKCDLAISIPGNGRRVWAGLHERCRAPLASRIRHDRRIFPWADDRPATVVTSTCVYLRDGTKIVMRREGQRAWLERVPQEIISTEGT